MNELTRFGVSMEEELLEKFDTLIKDKGYDSRSEAIRDLVREALLEEKLDDDCDVYGTLVIVFDHSQHEISHKLTHIQHNNFAKIISSLHVHIDEAHCIENIILFGNYKDVKDIANYIKSIKGVKIGKLVISSLKE